MSLFISEVVILRHRSLLIGCLICALPPITSDFFFSATRFRNLPTAVTAYGLMRVFSTIFGAGIEFSGGERLLESGVSTSVRVSGRAFLLRLENGYKLV